MNKLKKCIDKHSYEYIVRIVSNQLKNKKYYKHYAITIPSNYVEKYKLYKQKFKVKMIGGKFILYTSIRR